MKDIVCERISKNRFHITAFNYALEAPAVIFHKCEIIALARKWKEHDIDLENQIKKMFNLSALRHYGEEIEAMVQDRVANWNSITDV